MNNDPVTGLSMAALLRSLDTREASFCNPATASLSAPEEASSLISFSIALNFDACLSQAAMIGARSLSASAIKRSYSAALHARHRGTQSAATSSWAGERRQKNKHNQLLRPIPRHRSIAAMRTRLTAPQQMRNHQPNYPAALAAYWPPLPVHGVRLQNKERNVAKKTALQNPIAQFETQPRIVNSIK
jgi:hypothetical protein